MTAAENSVKCNKAWNQHHSQAQILLKKTHKILDYRIKQNIYLR